MFKIAQKNDLPAIVAIYNQAIKTRQSTADLQAVTVAERRTWFYQHNVQQRPLWIICWSNQTVGWLSLSDFNPRAAYRHTTEVSLYLDNNYQGKHLGTAALQFMEKQLPQYDIQTVVALIFSHNQASQRLFQNFGYQNWGHLPQVAELDGLKRDLDYLGRKYLSK
ncbi:N-acetyltransferase family protein [Lactobacillus sp. DCY120]|uniref:N-acetyltransferase family protein n=1 Tax=Bombilactobacillus apium TaxID=2675299 RepID=A0A850R830_9LACO|nr:GNAT family N-acetyltransferase [Bombilactobacillus apium]NVY97007.1 N-acetyltransferase family protein [Bombilactobacillus apium]